MKIKNLICLLFIAFISFSSFAQTKVSGIVVDNENQPVPYANVLFKGSNQGIVTNEDGRFYLESEITYKAIIVSFSGFETKEVTLPKSTTYNFVVKINDSHKLKEVVIFTGKTSKKNNPALDILRKIWARKRKNGLNVFKQYQMDKYEKVEFDLNTIDSAFMSSKVFKGMEFIFKQVDTSKVTGKTYLPIFINESIYEFYGDNQISKTKEILKANKNSGLGNGEGVNSFIKDLYSNYDIYNNYIQFFDKNFTSPLSKTGIDVYNYVLRDSSFIDKKWCYNIVFYPRRKNELTFKGDFWVNDSTFAIKNINMSITKSANINWVKDIYVEQDFEVVSDSIFLLTRDYMMSDFSFSKEEKAKGIYGKRTTLFRNHKFNIEKPASFYREKVNYIDNSVFKKSNEYWSQNRFESLSKDELGVYKMLDTLKTVKKFNQMYDLATILGSGYIHPGNLEYGPIFSTFGYNDVEGFRIRFGGRTYFGPNDLWRIQFYAAYGFKDDKFKHGFSSKYMINKANRVILAFGNRRDVEQIGASLTSTNDVLGRSYASSGLFTAGSNGKLTNINLTSLSVEIEPVRNLVFQAGMSYRKLVSASSIFKLDYFTSLPTIANPSGTTRPDLKQTEFNLEVEYTPNKKTIGYGVERRIIDNPYSKFLVYYSRGFKGFLDSDFDYQKLQLFYKKPIIIGAIGRSNLTIELGKTFGNVPLGLLSVVPGNQTYFKIENTFNNLNFYEFVTDQYATFQWLHNFNGVLFARVPFLRKLNWREVIGIKGVYGSISKENTAINASGLVYKAPTDPYWEYSAGIGNIFKVLRIDFSWRGSYLNVPETSNFTIKGAVGFYF
jgi:hypothetical protein